MRRFIVDGYNLLHASPHLKELADEDMEAAREALSAELLEFAGRSDCHVELVFDAGGREGPARSEERSRLLTVTYTAARQTADAYIEKLVYRVGAPSPEEVVVVTGDYAQQRIAGGAGMLRMSPREFLEEIAETRRSTGEITRGHSGRKGAGTLGERLPEDVKAALERIRIEGRQKNA